MKAKRLFGVFVLFFMLAACGPREVLKIGTPFKDDGQEGVEYEVEVKDAELIEELRVLLDGVNVEATSPGEDFTADMTFKVDRPEEHTGVDVTFVWFQEDGSSVIHHPYGSYYVLDKEKTERMREITQQ
ncbi:hypothetical protein Q73_00350 [Bacillus coahuilensis m2-6]|uniref:hypothetical protein n=1 Tax=Bacillus coahuilensis TaxID=408580 RepID=UPI000185096B|nr:hypothetical protein [Bacillus coahuilensis]KUP09924.1 hypothetical protein Q73_00350 [Bacillus coahuilensis m2-6]